MLISIIMPAYNAEKYIEDSIKSVLNQTWSEWELIVINDCSTDNTKTIIDDYSVLDSRIFMLSNPTNQGVAYSRNRGVQASHGDWIAFLDSDDLWIPEKLTLQVELLLHQHASFTFTGSAFIDEYGNKRSFILQVPAQINYKELLKQNLISCSSVLISKSLLLSHPMKSGNVHEDFVTWLSILRDMNICAYGLNIPALVYRIHSNSKSAQKRKAAKMNWNVYRQIGLKIGPCCYYQLCYAFRSIKKYAHMYFEH